MDETLGIYGLDYKFKILGAYILGAYISCLAIVTYSFPEILDD